MKVAVLGAGAVGGYFGARLLEAGRDVKFLVRPHRAASLRCTGLVVRSPVGDMRFKTPPLLPIDEPIPEFDLVILACKAYDLDSAIKAIAPAVGPKTSILPLLNGLRHFDALSERFGAEHVVGGLCSIGSTLAADGAVEHLSPMHVLRFGEFDKNDLDSPRIKALEALFAGTNIDAKRSSNIRLALCEKLVMLASLAALTCLMRANVGIIMRAPGGRETALAILDECCAVAAAHGYPPRPAVLDDTRAMLTDAQSKFTASMLRDVERGGRTEADHIFGDLIARAEATSVATPLLRLAYTNLKAYELRHKPH
jgi:2-dehydropantoate 2-reductase